MVIVFAFVVHWYISLFFQSFFMHRYAAHGHCTMSRNWERFFYIGSFLTQGSSYISATTYGLMHRLHHAHTDGPGDPHSPANTPNPFTMMWVTRNNYISLFKEEGQVDPKYLKDLPRWTAFDRFAHNWIARSCWGAVYLLCYCLFVTAWWQWAFFPLTLAMGSLHGVAVNWWAHKFGYRNFEVEDTSRNILPVDFLFCGEAYHNNHHKHPGRPDNAVRWFEFDPTYFVMRAMQRFRIIKIKPFKRSLLK